MNWWFEADPATQEELAWVDAFVRDEVEPLDLVLGHPNDLSDPLRRALIPPLQQQVRDRGLWACHLEPELGGQGYGQVKLALLNEILGRSRCGPAVFGCQAPDSGNAEILARFGSDHLKRSYLQPLLDNEIVSSFSMTEPQGGSDPTEFVTSARLDGDEWVIEGEKWFSSNARFASFLVVLAVTDAGAAAHRRQSMFVVPADTPGVTIVRNVGRFGDEPGAGTHGYVRYEEVRVPRENILGGIGDGFVVAQTRLGGGRIHHAMRAVGLMHSAFDMMCERALSRRTKGESLARKQLVQEMIAESWTELQQFRLLVLQTAWKIDRANDYDRVRADISAVKATMPKVLRNIAGRALQVHGSLGLSEEMPFSEMVLESYQLGLVDGATEVHTTTLARRLLADHRPSDDLFPTGHLPRRRAAAEQKFAAAIAQVREASS